MSSLTFSPVYNKERAKQNLKNINFEEDSDDDREWANSTDDENLLFDQPNAKPNVLKCELCNFSSTYAFSLKRQMSLQHMNVKKRKPEKETTANKKAKISHCCHMCDKSFSRKDSMMRHIQNMH